MLTSTHAARTARIAALNDLLRSNPSAHGHVLFTAGIMRLIDRDTPRNIAPIVMAQQQLIRLAALTTRFAGSPSDRDEHRCGCFTYLEHEIAFEIEYRHHKALRPSRDPADAKATRRILTIMLGCEAAPRG